MTTLQEIWGRMMASKYKKDLRWVYVSAAVDIFIFALCVSTPFYEANKWLILFNGVIIPICIHNFFGNLKRMFVYKHKIELFKKYGFDADYLLQSDKVREAAAKIIAEQAKSGRDC